MRGTAGVAETTATPSVGGRYLQRAGEVVTDDLLIGPSGVYDLHGGTLTSGGVRNDGEFTQDGGSYVASGDMINNGTYRLQPGQRLEVANLFNNGDFEIMGAYGRRAELLASGGSINIAHGATLGVAWGTVSIAGNIETNGLVEFEGEGETLIGGDVRIGGGGWGRVYVSGDAHGAAGQTVYVGGDVHIEQLSAPPFLAGSLHVSHSELTIGGDVFNRGHIVLHRGLMTVTGTLHILLDGVFSSIDGTLRARYVSLEGGLWLDPTQAFFGGFSVGETGYVTAGAGDQVFVEDDFIN